MTVVLDGKGYYGARFTPDVARFYQTGNPQSFYSFDIDANSSDFGSFHLRQFDVDQASITLRFYPTLQQIDYNFINNTVTGNCTVPVSQGSSNTTLNQCVTGSFDLGEPLGFNLNSAVPLNTTFNASSVPFISTPLKTVDKQWTFGDDAPSLILRTDSGSSDVDKIVLRTAVTKKGDCTQLKICVAGPPSGPEPTVGGSVMVPLGIILMRQADYAIECTTPSDN